MLARIEAFDGCGVTLLTPQHIRADYVRAADKESESRALIVSKRVSFPIQP